MNLSSFDFSDGWYAEITQPNGESEKGTIQSVSLTCQDILDPNDGKLVTVRWVKFQEGDDVHSRKGPIIAVFKGCKVTLGAVYIDSIVE